MLDTSTFVRSSLAVRDNAVKNIIFKAASLLFQFSLARIFAFITFKTDDYTSFLMFTESLIQKMFFARSRSFNSRAMLVLSFAALTVLFGLYDTMLWALDSPGYITQHTSTRASSLTSNLLQNPAYITFIGNPSHEVNDIDIEEAITSNLFKPGFNFSLTPVANLGPKTTVRAPRNLTESGARVWLDNEGFSVGLDQGYAISATYGACPLRDIDLNTQSWKCTLNSSEANTILLNRLGDPQIWWYGNNTELLPTDRKGNPWQSLSTGGDTAVMKSLFTVTRGKRRHTFLQTVSKVSMLTRLPPFDDADITDVIRRTWSPDPSQPIDNTTQILVDMVLKSHHSNTSLTFGINVQEQEAVLSSSIELLNAIPTNDFLFTLLRIGSVNITLLRSEDLKQAPVPYTDCSESSTNIATGGRVQSSNCYKPVDLLGDKTFKGQIDTSSVVIFSNVIGDGSSSKAAVAFNQSGYDWYRKREGRIDDMLIARGVLLGGDKDIVDILVLHNVAAISYLQLFLSILPLALSIGIWILTELLPMSYYKSSFLAALMTTTHLSPSTGPSKTCKRVSTLRNPPELMLVNLGDGHTMIQTGDGEVLVGQSLTTPISGSAGLFTTDPTSAKEEFQVLMDPPFLQHTP